MAQPAISVSNLTKVYGESLKALDDVSLEVEEGSFFGLLGPNGAGKTTLISVLGGLSAPTTGNAAVMGHDVVRDPQGSRRNIGIVPQEVVFDPFFTTRQYLLQQSSYYGIYDNHEWVDKLIDTMGLGDKADENTRKLSGGMKRRLNVAMAMVHRPRVVVLDEPTAGVDVSQRRTLWSFIRDINKDGTTVVLTTHYLEEAEELCERIVMLDSGKVIADQRTADLLGSSWHHNKCMYVRLAEGEALPEGIAQEHTGEPDGQGRYHISFDEYSEVERIAASLNRAGVTIEEMEIAPPDLEDVFISIMESRK